MEQNKNQKDFILIIRRAERSEAMTLLFRPIIENDIGSRPRTKHEKPQKLIRIFHQIRPKLAHLILRLFCTFPYASILNGITFQGNIGFFRPFAPF